VRSKVSIIMPVLNGERYIGEALESVLAQTYCNYELIVVDDGSTDNTYEKVHAFLGKLDLKYLRHDLPKGIPASVNDGLRKSAGEFIAFLDHDDAWLPEMLETQVTHLERHADVGMVHSDFQTIDSQGQILEESVARCRNLLVPSGYIFPQLFMDCFIVANSVLIRKECFDRLGYFDESLPFGDYHTWLRISRFYKVDYVPKVLTKYRQHPSQSTRNVSIARPTHDSVALTVIKNLLDLYPEIREELGERTLKRRFASLYFDMAYDWFAKGGFGYARPLLIQAIRLWPGNYKYHLYYLASLLQPSHAWALQQAWRKFHMFATAVKKS
jgi:glycosyltransferase involved in cell wall biosynthesis